MTRLHKRIKRQWHNFTEEKETNDIDRTQQRKTQWRDCIEREKYWRYSQGEVEDSDRTRGTWTRNLHAELQSEGEMREKLDRETLSVFYVAWRDQSWWPWSFSQNTMLMQHLEVSSGTVHIYVATVDWHWDVSSVRSWEGLCKTSWSYREYSQCRKSWKIKNVAINNHWPGWLSCFDCAASDISAPKKPPFWVCDPFCGRWPLQVWCEQPEQCLGFPLIRSPWCTSLLDSDI